MKMIALLVILAFSAGVLSSMRNEFVRQNDLKEKEILLEQMQIISSQCASKSGSVDFEKGDLHYDSKKQAQTKKFRPKQMPNVI